MAQGDIVYYSQPNIYGTKFRCSKRTAEHLNRTKYRLKKKHPNASLKIIQGSYNTTVEISAGTHDKDAVLDVGIEGLSWSEAQRFLREQGWAAWVRTPAQGFSYHIHMVSLPPFKLRWKAPVGQYVPGQVNQYYNHTDGLSGVGPDNTWHPKSIRRTIFNYGAWVTAKKLRNGISRITSRIRDLRKERGRLRDRLKKIFK